jgi:hypothetical protein
MLSSQRQPSDDGRRLRFGGCFSLQEQRDIRIFRIFHSSVTFIIYKLYNVLYRPPMWKGHPFESLGESKCLLRTDILIVKAIYVFKKKYFFNTRAEVRNTKKI